MKTKTFLFILLVLSLSACSALGQTPTPLPTVALGSGDTSATAQPQANTASGGVTASGVVVPAQETTLAFALAGNVKAVQVKEGDQVEAGQLLAELDNTSIQMAVAQAERNLKELTSAAAQAAAAQSVANAKKTLDDTQDKADSMFFPRASDTLTKNTQGEIDLAKQAVARAADRYRQVARLAEGDSRKASALVALTSAQMNLNNLVAKYNWYSGKPTEIDAALAQANLDAAKAALQEAEWYLSALKGEEIPAEATGSKLAALEQAKNNLAIAQENLAHTRLSASIAGTVIAVNVIAGEFIAPGQILFRISDVANLQVETTDLSERNVAQVAVGQSVSIFVEALNETITGTVVRISPVSNTLGGDVVYKTTIELESPPAGLLAGMSVDVKFKTE